MTQLKNTKIEFGDFQTPLELANRICQKLLDLGIKPDVVIEPTCGIGAFVQASVFSFPSLEKVVAVDVNEQYLDELQRQKAGWQNSVCVDVTAADFFQFDWPTLFEANKGSILVLGNFPWVTNSQQGDIGGANLPQKQNLHKYNGMDALTGKSNFDISEWMFIQMATLLQQCNGSLAMICKSSVARKFLSYLHDQKIGLAFAAMFGIDARRYFSVSVESCLLVCRFQAAGHEHDYHVYADLDTESYHCVGHRQGVTVRDLALFEKHHNLFGVSEIKWRSGIKHDCSAIMELEESNGFLRNGIGEVVDCEAAYVYPLLKGSDVANGRTTTTKRYLLVPQKTVGEETKPLRQIAPKLWSYLERHASIFEDRKSRIYQNNPRFSIFGVGDYTFAPWKIAICGLYKNLQFRLIGNISNKPVVFDDTVYFISFDDKEEACATLAFLHSQPVLEFLSSLVFWDEKRPIKTSILHCLKLQQPNKTRNLSLFSLEPFTN